MSESRPVSTSSPEGAVGDLRVDCSDVAAFARALGVTADTVPFLFAVRSYPGPVRSVLGREHPAVDPGRVRHVVQDMWRSRPLRVGETVEVRPARIAAGDLGFGRAVVIGVDLCDEEGRTVGASRITLVVGPALGGGPRLPVETDPVPGPAAASWVEPVPAGLAADYARVSGDDNPVHTSPAAARRAGLPGVVVHGMATLHLVLLGMSRRHGVADRSLRRVRCRFAAVVRPGDEVHCEVRAVPGGYAVRGAVDGRPVLKDARIEVW